MRHKTIIAMFLSHLVATLQKIRSFFERTKQKRVKKNLAIPNRYLLVQSQKWKHQKSVWNMFKVNNKETRATFMKPSGTFIVSFEHISHSFLCFHSWVWTSKCRFVWIIFSMKCLDRNLGRNSAKTQMLSEISKNSSLNVFHRKVVLEIFGKILGKFHNGMLFCRDACYGSSILCIQYAMRPVANVFRDIF